MQMQIPGAAPSPLMLCDMYTSADARSAGIVSVGVQLTLERMPRWTERQRPTMQEELAAQFSESSSGGACVIGRRNSEEGSEASSSGDDQTLGASLPLTLIVAPCPHQSPCDGFCQLSARLVAGRRSGSRL